MAYRRWLDNAFWETPEKDKVNCILEMEDDVGRQTTQVFLLHKVDAEGNPNPMFQELLDAHSEESIDKNTEERKARKEAERQEVLQKEEEHAKARKLERLFNHKLELFETDEIKNSKNRQLKAKIRRSKSQVEAMYYAFKLLEESIQEESESVGEE